jgi:hypothetical protein
MRRKRCPGASFAVDVEWGRVIAGQKDYEKCGASSKRFAEPMLRSWVNHEGHFGIYGGQYVPETLMHPLRN